MRIQFYDVLDGDPVVVDVGRYGRKSDDYLVCGGVASRVAVVVGDLYHAVVVVGCR